MTRFQLQLQMMAEMPKQWSMMRNPHPLSSSQLVAGIETLINAGQYDAAIRRLKLLLHDHTDDARLHHIAGVAQLRAGRAAKAISKVAGPEMNSETLIRLALKNMIPAG